MLVIIAVIAVLVVFSFMQRLVYQHGRAIRPIDGTPDTSDEFIEALRYYNSHLRGLDAEYAVTQSFIIALFDQVHGGGGHCAVGQATSDGWDDFDRFYPALSDVEYIRILSLYKNDFKERWLVLVEPKFDSQLSDEQREIVSNMQVIDQAGNIYQKLELGKISVFFKEYETNPKGLEVFAAFAIENRREKIGVIDDLYPVELK